MLLPPLVFSAISITFAILQTNVLSFVSFQTVLPDISYIVVVYFSFTCGVMQGQISGFATGLAFDFMSLSPFGFNSFVSTVCGHVVGRFKGMVRLDNFILPMGLVASSLIFKAIISIVLALVLGIPSVVSRIFSTQFLIQLFFTILVTPIVFWPLRGIHSLIQSRRAYR